MDFQNKRIGIWGHGREGQAAERFLRDYGGYHSLTILSDTDSEAIAAGAYDIIIKSPGISLYRPEIITAKSKGTDFTSATNLWFHFKKHGQVIGITGTKGKSTSASLLYHIMKQAGYSVALAGNIGIPALDLKEETAFTILELSSYQLADLEHAPDIFCVLNLFPEHQNWHGTTEQYYRDKLSPLRLNDPFTVIGNYKNQLVRESFQNSDKKIIWFNDHDFTPIETTLKGHHNQENIQAALTICDTIGLPRETALPHIKSFQGLPHRLQEFQSSHGVMCINDSISTTPETTLAALEIYKNHPIILILGGQNRGQNFNELINKIKELNIKFIITLDETGAIISKNLNSSDYNGKIIACNDLSAACDWVLKQACEGYIVLLSPAAPSYNQFKNFEERGALFMEKMT